MAGGAGGARGAARGRERVETRRAHGKIDQRQRTLERIRVKFLSKHVALVGERLLVDQLMLIRLLRKRFLNNVI